MAIMSQRLRRLVRPMLGRLGYDVQRVRPGAWLVQRPLDHRPPLRMQRIGWAKTAPVLLAEDDGTSKRRREHRNTIDQFYADEHLSWLLEKLRIDCVLDVGANRGQFARRLRRLGYAGRIASFEPVAHQLADLRLAAESDPGWFVHPYALGERDGAAEINVAAGKGTMSSMLEPSEFGREWSLKLRDTHAETIEVRRLDSVLDEATAGLSDPRIFLKLDTQGYDLQAFRGGGDRLTEILALQSEVACVPIYDAMPRMPEQLSEYESAGFAMSAMFPVTRHRKSMRVIEFDALMVRPEATGGSDSR
jgi:FkbM family methyltransferase